MFLFFRKQISFETLDSKEEFIKRLLQHLSFSNSKNFFTAMTDDYAIKGVVEKDKIVIWDKFDGSPTKMEVTIDAAASTRINVTVVPSVFVRIYNFVFFMVMIAILTIMQFPFEIYLGIIAILYLLSLVRFAFQIWWVSNLFENKLIKEPVRA
jgi:hypothetical protein